jgi:hypothetical protein
MNPGKLGQYGERRKGWNGLKKNGNGWNIGRLGNLGKLDTDGEHGKVGQFKEVVWRVLEFIPWPTSRGMNFGKSGAMDEFGGNG